MPKVRTPLVAPAPALFPIPRGGFEELFEAGGDTVPGEALDHQAACGFGDAAAAAGVFEQVDAGIGEAGGVVG